MSRVHHRGRGWTNEAEPVHGRTDHRDPARSRNRTCDLCLRSKITCPSEKCDRARYATLSTGSNWIFSTTTATFLSETPHRFSPACLRVAYLGDRARNEGTSWSRLQRELSRRRGRGRRTPSWGSTNCWASAPVFWVRESAATSP